MEDEVERLIASSGDEIPLWFEDFRFIKQRILPAQVRAMSPDERRILSLYFNSY
jgi:hypothetical protein